jgi:Na+/proline symporter
VTPLSILILGAFTLVYTYHGGMRAVVWTDVLQTGIYLLGGAGGVYLHRAGRAGRLGAILDAAARRASCA